MQLASHELNDLNELTMSCVNSITNMGYMLQHIQDPEFKSIVERHLPYHIRDYNMKVEFLNEAGGAKRELSLIKEEGHLQSYTVSGTASTPVQPRTTVEHMNDREMATAYLLTLKRAGREYAWAAMEMANPEVRSFCQTAFMMSCAHAYDMWQYMVKKGYYALEPAAPELISRVGSMYEVIPEDQPQLQPYMNQSGTPEAGTSGQMYQ